MPKSGDSSEVLYRGVAGGPPGAPRPPILVRTLHEDDDLAALTSMLHRAYRVQVEMGLKPLAGRQTIEITRQRCFSGVCYVAVITENSNPEKIIGCILFQEHEDAQNPPWFRREDVGHFSLFAVDPDYQSRGIGGQILSHLEAHAREISLNHLALSMAEPDEHLMNWYLHRGYRFIEYWQWPYTNYRSAILSKALIAP